MTLQDRLRAVAEAEAHCQAQAERARGSWQKVKSGAGQLATPWRIVAVGLALGFLAGRKARPGEHGVGGKVLAAAAQALATAFGAGVTAEVGEQIEDAVQAGLAAGSRAARGGGPEPTRADADADAETD